MSSWSLTYQHSVLSDITVTNISHSFTYKKTKTNTRLTALFPGLPEWAGTRKVQEAPLSPRDRAMRRVN